jgi:hypothetical protein
MVIGACELTGDLDELIEALDRRVARAEQPGEAAIARDAATLRAKVVDRLAELAKKRQSRGPGTGLPT